MLLYDYCISEDKLQVFGRFDKPVHVLKKFLRGHTGVNLRCLDIGMPQHPADGLDWHTLFKRYQACETMPSDMIDDVSLDACQCS